jgi:membrane fusion protein (multidrug efflux system)
MKSLTTLSLSTLLLFVLSGCERPKATGMQKPPEGPTPISIIEVQSGNFADVLTATGQTQAFNTVQVYARVNGYLAKRAYTEGSEVHKGQTLFSIDPADLKNSLASAKAAYQLAQANHTNALAILSRTKPLAAANASSQQDLDTAIANERNTDASVMSAKALLDQAALNLSYTTIKSPIDGYADRAKIDVGTYVATGANALLTTVYQTNPLYVTFTLSENQRLVTQNAIASGKLLLPKNNDFTIALTLSDGSTLKRKGKIDFIAPSVDPTTGNVVYRAVVENHDHLLLPGQFVKVSVEGMEWKNALYVPQKALLTGEKGKFVYAVEANNTVTQKYVNASKWIRGNVLIDGDIHAGEKIASDGLVKLKPGGEIIPPEKQ